MSGADGDSCNSCLSPYNSKDRVPKVKLSTTIMSHNNNSKDRVPKVDISITVTFFNNFHVRLSLIKSR